MSPPPRWPPCLQNGQETIAWCFFSSPKNYPNPGSTLEPSKSWEKDFCTRQLLLSPPHLWWSPSFTAEKAKALPGWPWDLLGWSKIPQPSVLGVRGVWTTLDVGKLKHLAQAVRGELLSSLFQGKNEVWPRTRTRTAPLGHFHGQTESLTSPLAVGCPGSLGWEKEEVYVRLVNFHKLSRSCFNFCLSVSATLKWISGLVLLVVFSGLHGCLVFCRCCLLVLTTGCHV